MVLVAHLRHHARARLLGHQHAALLVGMRERLLDVDVLAEAHRVQAHDRVRVVGRAHRHRVEVLVVLEELAPVHVRGDAGMLFRLRGERVRVHVAERRHRRARLAEQVARGRADAARADHRETQLPAGQLLPVERARGDEERPRGRRAEKCPSSLPVHHLAFPLKSALRTRPQWSVAFVSAIVSYDCTLTVSACAVSTRM